LQQHSKPAPPVTRAGHEVLAYEQAEQILAKVNRIAVAPCICRRERKLAGDGCGRLEESCLVYGTGADVYVRNGFARRIDRTEALAILKKAEQQKLVLQPGYSKKPGNICMCCGCCCGVLRTLETYERPSDLVSNALRAVHAPRAAIPAGPASSAARRAPSRRPKTTRWSFTPSAASAAGCAWPAAPRRPSAWSAIPPRSRHPARSPRTTSSVASAEGWARRAWPACGSLRARTTSERDSRQSDHTLIRVAGLARCTA